MIGVIEAHQLWFGIQNQIGHGAVGHRSPPGVDVAVHEEGEAEGQGPAVSDHDGGLARVSGSDLVVINGSAGGCSVFGDGFETGDFTGWTGTMP